MDSLEAKKMEEYLNNEITLIVEKLFKNLSEKNIDVEKERNELTLEELENYIDIYNQYEKDLIKLKENTILKFGEFNNFDYIFATMIQEIVTKKNKELWLSYHSSKKIIILPLYFFYMFRKLILE